LSPTTYRESAGTVTVLKGNGTFTASGKERIAAKMLEVNERGGVAIYQNSVLRLGDDVSRKADHSLEQETIEFVMLKHD